MIYCLLVIESHFYRLGDTVVGLFPSGNSTIIAVLVSRVTFAWVGVCLGFFGLKEYPEKSSCFIVVVNGLQQSIICQGALWQRSKNKLILNVLQQKTILAEAATCCYLLLDVVIDRWIVL